MQFQLLSQIVCISQIISTSFITHTLLVYFHFYFSLVYLFSSNHTGHYLVVYFSRITRHTSWRWWWWIWLNRVWFTGCQFCQTLKIHLYGYMGGDSTKDLRIYNKKAKESTGIYLYTWVSAKVSFFLSFLASILVVTWSLHLWHADKGFEPTYKFNDCWDE